MQLTLTRKIARPDGIISDIKDDRGLFYAHTLEHSYAALRGVAYAAKIPTGQFTCKRGPHRLHGMTADFETFEITGVEGHTNLLFHWGNYNEDSDGCILLGTSYAVTPAGKAMVTASRAKFTEFMNLMTGVNEFTLTVKAE